MPLERYALSMDLIEIRTAPSLQVVLSFGWCRWRLIGGCVPPITRFCDCKLSCQRLIDARLHAEVGRPGRLKAFCTKRLITSIMSCASIFNY